MFCNMSNDFGLTGHEMEGVLGEEAGNRFSLKGHIEGGDTGIFLGISYPETSFCVSFGISGITMDRVDEFNFQMTWLNGFGRCQIGEEMVSLDWGGQKFMLKSQTKELRFGVFRLLVGFV